MVQILITQPLMNLSCRQELFVAEMSRCLQKARVKITCYVFNVFKKRQKIPAVLF